MDESAVEAANVGVSVPTHAIVIESAVVRDGLLAVNAATPANVEESEVEAVSVGVSVPVPAMVTASDTPAVNVDVVTCMSFATPAVADVDS